MKKGEPRGELSGFNALGYRVAKERTPVRYFAEKRVLITGASSGIGRSTAVWLLNQGARVAMIGRDIPELNVIGKQFPNQAVVVACDLAVDHQQYDMALTIIEMFGGLDILINAAGIIFEGDLETTYPQDHDYIIDINLRAVYHISQLTLSFLEKSHGCIVNLSCEWGHRPQAGMISYCMSKAGVEMLTKCLALELAPSGVRVNAVAPAATQTNLLKYAGFTDREEQGVYKTVGDKNPMKRTAYVDDVVKAIAFLCSKRAQSITGQVISVDGGASLTNSTFCHWDGLRTMNAKLVPTGVKTMPLLMKLVNEGFVRKWKPVERDHNWVRKQHTSSNWATHLADAHVKVTDNYSKLDKSENVLSGYEEMKAENGQIYTTENPKQARREGGENLPTLSKMSAKPITPSFIERTSAAPEVPLRTTRRPTIKDMDMDLDRGAALRKLMELGS